MPIDKKISQLPLGTPGNNDLIPYVDTATGETKRALRSSLVGSGTGDVTGPASSVDNAIVRMDGTTGKAVQSSNATIDDSGNISANNLSGTNTGDQDLSPYATKTGAETLENKTLSTTQEVGFDTTRTGDVAKGEIAWDEDKETLVFGLNGESVKLPDPFNVSNRTGSTITKGTNLAFDGSLGVSGKIKVVPYDVGTHTPDYQIGIALADIADSVDDGLCTRFNVIRGIDTSAWTAGTKLYPSQTTPGAWQSTKPTTGDKTAYASVLIQHATNGEIQYRYSKPTETLTDIDYDNSTSGLSATDPQGAIDELDTTVDGIKTKTDYISVTQAVDLDQMETDIAALANGMVYKGDWDASSGIFPGAGSAQTGWFYYVSVAGTVDSVDFAVGDNIVATTDNASTTTYSGNWSKHDQTDAVQSIFGRTGSIVATEGDYTKEQITGLKTTDTPQFTGIELGHATDTTITRTSAGQIAIEGVSVTTESNTQTFTGKSFDANGTGNSLSNVEVADMATSAVVTEAEGISSNDNDTTFPTSAAVKDYVDKYTINAQTGTTYIFVLADSTQNGTILNTFTNASAITVTVPPNSSVAFPVGTQIDLAGLGAGAVTLVQGTGVTINSEGSNKTLNGQYVAASLIQTAANTWLLVGNLTT